MAPFSPISDSIFSIWHLFRHQWHLFPHEWHLQSIAPRPPSVAFTVYGTSSPLSGIYSPWHLFSTQWHLQSMTSLPLSVAFKVHGISTPISGISLAIAFEDPVLMPAVLITPLPFAASVTLSAAGDVCSEKRYWLVRIFLKKLNFCKRTFYGNRRAMKCPRYTAFD